ncbi:hypothetical protein AVEN_53096-1 [Araneus ventricosus]|uniref:Uncharacterized protein n=1 Tax=Araneus ventricosus TaxID=182803 RepID=A0A4Y2VP60_ARAVE|nr:hypothetical protein AVEN_53096-1 [Araneus ventricosus]
MYCKCSVVEKTIQLACLITLLMVGARRKTLGLHFSSDICIGPKKELLGLLPFSRPSWKDIDAGCKDLAGGRIPQNSRQASWKVGGQKCMHRASLVDSSKKEIQLDLRPSLGAWSLKCYSEVKKLKKAYGAD